MNDINESISKLIALAKKTGKAEGYQECIRLIKDCDSVPESICLVKTCQQCILQRVRDKAWEEL